MNYKISSINFIQPFARKQKRSKIRRVKLGPAVPLEEPTWLVHSFEYFRSPKLAQEKRRRRFR